MALDDENEHGDELEDFGEELSSDYKEETEEGLGEEGEEIEEEVAYRGGGDGDPRSGACARRRQLPSLRPPPKKAPAKKKAAKKAKAPAKKPVKKAAKKAAKTKKPAAKA